LRINIKKLSLKNNISTMKYPKEEYSVPSKEKSTRKQPRATAAIAREKLEKLIPKPDDETEDENAAVVEDDDDDDNEGLLQSQSSQKKKLKR
jgi:hypothetical protein